MDNTILIVIAAAAALFFIMRRKPSAAVAGAAYKGAYTGASAAGGHRPEVAFKRLHWAYGVRMGPRQSGRQSP